MVVSIISSSPIKVAVYETIKRVVVVGRGRGPPQWGNKQPVQTNGQKSGTHNDFGQTG